MVKAATIKDQELDALVAKSRDLPRPRGDYRVDDYVDNLMLTVLDYALHTAIVVNAMEYFKKHARPEIRTAAQLEAVLGRYPDDREGNLELALHLWGMRYWNRARQLRDLVAYFLARHVTTQEALCRWAVESDFARDFQGRVRGLSYAVYQWLVIRQGVETIKPDVWVKRFVQETIGRLPSDEEVVDVLVKVARMVDRGPHELDWAIWEAQRGKS